MLSSEPTLTKLVDDRHPDLVVSYFVRNGCSVEVPIAIINLMESFYSMWKKRRLSPSELRSIKALTLGHSEKIELFRLKFKGGVIPIYMAASKTINSLHMFLWSMIPPEMKYIGGFFGDPTLGTNQTTVQWKRDNNPNSEPLPNPYSVIQKARISVSKLLSCTELTVSTYFEITQIKYADGAKTEDFDVTPLFKKQGRFQWVIEGEELKELQNYPGKPLAVKASTIRDEWKFKLFHCTFGINSKTIDLAPEHPFLPLDVGGYTMEFIVRYQDKVMWGDHTYKTTIMQQRGQMAFPSYSSLMFAVEDIKGESRIELDVEWKLKKLYDMEGEEIRTES